MKTKFIRIKDISDIDASRTTVYDLNNRYIDSKGNMFGLRFNRKTKKIDIIKIIRTPAEASGLYERQILESKKNNHKKPEIIPEDKIINKAPLLDEFNGFQSDEGEPELEELDKSEFIPDEFINESLELMATHKMRIYAIINNINGSQFFFKTTRELSGNMEDLFRNLDIDGMQRIDKTLNLHKELSNYPRSVNYYMPKLDNASREFVELLTEEEHQMRFIYLHEMFNSIKNLYRTLLRIIQNFHELLNNIGKNDLKELQHNDRQHIEDAKTSVENTINEINTLNKKLKKFKKYINTAENF